MMTLLAINVGSSSVRLELAALAGDKYEKLATYHNSAPLTQAEARLRDFLARNSITPVRAVVHRIVHGGARLVQSCMIDDDVEMEIERLAALAPLHNPTALAWIHASRVVLGSAIPQVAVFDTAFYADLPPVARSYALPRQLGERSNIRRFGFHGLAHQSMWRRWRQLRSDARRARVISLQLGAGCSMTATLDGRTVDTSMGFSPLEGLMMATRSGDVDPGLLLFLQRELSLSTARVEEILNHESGLLGVSGVSADMPTLLASNDDSARLAVELYCYRARKYLGSYLAVLGGADAILFGGGVGENSPEIRARILDGMLWAKIELDTAANRNAVGVEARIDARIGGPDIWTVPVDEMILLAEEARLVLSRATS